MAMQERKKRDPIAKALKALSWMVQEAENDVGVRELAAALNISPSSAHRILSALVDEGYLRQIAETSRYALGLEFLRLSHITTSRLPLRQIAQSHMQTLAEQSRETVTLGLYDRSRRQMMHAASVDPPDPHSLRFVVKLNEWLPVYAGATGLSIMAYLAPEEIEAIIDETQLRALTPHTISDPNAMLRALRKIRQQGYAISRGQRIPDAGAIAAPVFAREQGVIGDICISIPKQRMDAGKERELAALVMACASRVSAELGGITE